MTTCWLFAATWSKNPFRSGVLKALSSFPGLAELRTQAHRMVPAGSTSLMHWYSGWFWKMSWAERSNSWGDLGFAE